jgi:TolB-like protein/Flp pilus assembly protein TadD
MTAPIQERRIVQWAVAYLGAAWLVFQVIDALADVWGIPAWAIRASTVLLGAGFIAALVLAWYHGEKGRQKVSGPELLLLGGIALSTAFLLRLATNDGSQALPANDAAPAPAVAENTIAVLPFRDLSPDGSQQYFGDGMADEIISVLSRDGRIRIAGRSSSFSLRDRPAREIGEALSVATVLEGTIRTEGDRMRIQVSLVSAEDGFERWSTRFDRSITGVLQIQAEIAAAVVAELTDSQVGSIAEAAALPPEASDLYFRARAHWVRRTPHDLARALELFQQTIALAPDYARAHSGLADTYAVSGFYNYLPAEEAFPAARRYATEALSIDPGLADAFATIAYADTYYERDWEAAEAGFLRAIELSPDHAVAHQWYANLLTILGQHDEAIAELRRAVSLEPLSIITRAALPWGLYYARRYDESLARLEEILEVDPEYPLAHYWKGWVLAQTGRMDEAIASLELAHELSEGAVITLAALAGAYGRAGRQQEAVELLTLLTDPERTPNPPIYEVGKAYLALGRTDEAFAWFERALEERAQQFAFIGVDPEVDALRWDPRFQRLLSEIGLEDVGGSGTP